MRRDLLTAGALAPVTTVAMYAVYATHAAATGAALSIDSGHLRLPRPLRWGGVGLAAGGVGLCVAGMGRFTGPGQVSGTDTGPIVTAGVYRLSRNPQYVGYTAALAGLSAARRSPTALVLSGVVAAAYRWWVPVEEQHLDQVFGADYRAYRSRTPRWLGVSRPSTKHAGNLPSTGG